MNQYITGTAIKELREQKKMTKLQLAEVLGVRDKTVSKWETAKGYPDITLLEPIADAFKYLFRNCSQATGSAMQMYQPICCGLRFISARFAGM